MGFIDTPSSPCLMDILDFNIDETEIVDDDDDIENPNSIPPLPLTECEEYEELEWISNKDLFPSVDTFVPCPETLSDVIPSNTTIVALKHESPVSVLDHSTSSFKSSNSNNSIAAVSNCARPRSKEFKRRRRSGRKCTHCGSEKTPQWRAGPNGPKTLCNACGVRFKSGRLCPEYRPASSPTFCDTVHSNSHRKIVEMRKMKLMSNETINLVDNG